MEAPKKSLVENYMIEIARNYKVEYDPDPSMFLVSDPSLLLSAWVGRLDCLDALIIKLVKVNFDLHSSVMYHCD